MRNTSRYYYVRIKGDYALWTSPESKGGGEKSSYSVPTRQALTGIADAIYFKPVFYNVVDAVKVVNKIQTEVVGIRALIGSGKINTADLNYYSYLRDVEYEIKFHFEWNLNREDLAKDRDLKKHQAILERSLKKGGRRDVFLGTRECVGLIEEISEDDFFYKNSYYDEQLLNMGIMFQEFEYPQKPGGKLKSYYANTEMKEGYITYSNNKDDFICNVLSDYYFKYPVKQKSVDEELNDE